MPHLEKKYQLEEKSKNELKYVINNTPSIMKKYGKVINWQYRFNLINESRIINFDWLFILK